MLNKKTFLEAQGETNVLERNETCIRVVNIKYPSSTSAWNTVTPLSQGPFGEHNAKHCQLTNKIPAMAKYIFKRMMPEATWDVKTHRG